MENSKVSEKILKHIKLQGPTTAQDLADVFSVTPMAIRQHLYLHNKNGLIEYDDIKTARGRPKRLWKLTEIAQNAYTDNASIQFSQFINILINREALVQHQIIDLYKQTLFLRYPKTVQAIQKLDGHNINLILAQLTQEANNLGYLFEYSQMSDNDFMLIEHHEPLRKLCQFQDFIKNIEIHKYEVILGNIFKVVVINHILNGYYRSMYNITKRDDYVI